MRIFLPPKCKGKIGHNPDKNDPIGSIVSFDRKIVKKIFHEIFKKNANVIALVD